MIDALAQVMLELARGAADEFFVAGDMLVVGFALGLVGIRFEQGAEDVAVALRKVVQNQCERIVALREHGVFAAQVVGGVFEHVFHRRVEKKRESQVVEHGDTGPHEELGREPDELLSALLAPLQFFPYFLLVGHATKFRSWFRGCAP